MTMHLNCTNGHVIAKGQRFCGECGGKAAEADAATCTSCRGTIAKAAKFCSDCGTPTAAEEPALDEALEAINAFAKAQAAIQADLASLPEVDESIVDAGEVEALLKSATLRDNEGNEAVDATPVVTELLKSTNHLSAQQRLYAEHQQKVNDHLVAGAALLVKATAAMGRAFREFREEVQGWGAAPRGRKAATVPPEVLAKAMTGTEDIGVTDIPAGELMAKAATTPGLTATEISRLEIYTNSGMGLAAIAKDDPNYAATLRRAIAA